MILQQLFHPERGGNIAMSKDLMSSNNSMKENWPRMGGGVGSPVIILWEKDCFGIQRLSSHI